MLIKVNLRSSQLLKEKQIHTFEQMKVRFSKIFTLTLFLLVINYCKASAKTNNKTDNKNNDTVISINSNIVIFKMITTPSVNNTNGSLKKAGKVARTSNSGSSSKNKPLNNEG